jgi:hypothetical protein
MGNRRIELKVELGDRAQVQAFAQLAPNEARGMVQARKRCLLFHRAADATHVDACMPQIG